MQVEYPLPASPLRFLDDAELQAFADDGAVCARGLIDPGTIEGLQVALEDALQKLGVMKVNLPAEDDGFSGDVFTWKLHDGFRDFALFSSLPNLAQQILGTDTVNFFYEQFFVKRAGCPVETPWHQGHSFLAGGGFANRFALDHPGSGLACIERPGIRARLAPLEHPLARRWAPKRDGYLADHRLTGSA